VHVNGSPWAKHYCVESGCTNGGINSNIFGQAVMLDEPSGTITFVGQPGEFPPVDLASPPNLEGFRVCSLVVSFNDGEPDGSRASEQLNVDRDGVCGGR
jgi:hypothetical protein